MKDNIDEQKVPPMYFTMAATDEWPACKISWKPNPPGKYFPIETPRPPITLAQEVLLSVQEWYSSRGLPVPKEDVEACELACVPPPPPEEVTRQQEEKPAYGTPAFWKAYWAKKKASKKI
jgi:hypothetical protein